MHVKQGKGKQLPQVKQSVSIACHSAGSENAAQEVGEEMDCLLSLRAAPWHPLPSLITLHPLNIAVAALYLLHNAVAWYVGCLCWTTPVAFWYWGWALAA
jgi:hypothetical protein